MFGDPITADYPSRNISLEEDLAASKENVAEKVVEAPVINIDQDVIGKALVVLCGKIGSCLESSLVHGPCIGRIRGPSGTCEVHRGLNGMSVVAANVAPEYSVAWTNAVLAAVKPSAVYVVSGMTAYNFRGAFDGESTDHHIYCLHTNRDREISGAAQSTTTSPLPSGNLLDGLGAAVMLQAEVDSVPSSAIIAVELSRTPRYDLVCSLGDTLMSLLDRRGLSMSERDRIKQSCNNQFAASADLSVYV
jgi:hypothetical protein